MDPDSYLKEILDLAQGILNKADGCGDDEDFAEEAIDLAERVQNLHNWLLQGGQLPSSWKPGKSQ